MNDYIDRQAAIDAILDCCPSDFNNEYECGYYDGLRQGVHRLKHLPSAEVEPVKHGKWIVEHGVLYGHGKDVHYGDLWHCSECGRREIDVEGWDYCPTCGAKMESEE